jgi:hypothetical protein
MPLYHANRLDLKTGELIHPGNYGRIIQQTGPSHLHWHRETILEKIRLQLFPEKPCRLNATFCCDSLQTAQCYKSSQHRSEDFLYEVELVDPAAPLHKGDFNAVQPMPRRSETMHEIAFKYWRYFLKTNVAEWPGVECSEIVSAVPIARPAKAALAALKRQGVPCPPFCDTGLTRLKIGDITNRHPSSYYGFFAADIRVFGMAILLMARQSEIVDYDPTKFFVRNLDHDRERDHLPELP